MTPTVESAYFSVCRNNSTRVDEVRKCWILLMIEINCTYRCGERVVEPTMGPRNWVATKSEQDKTGVDNKWDERGGEILGLDTIIQCFDPSLLPSSCQPGLHRTAWFKLPRAEIILWKQTHNNDLIIARKDAETYPNSTKLQNNPNKVRIKSNIIAEITHVQSQQTHNQITQ